MGTFSAFWPDPGPAQTIGFVILIVFAAALVRLIVSAIEAWQQSRLVPRESDTPQQTLAVVSDSIGGAATVLGRLRVLSMYAGRAEALDASETVSAQQERAFDASLSWVRYAVSALLFLGLTGTVLGLAGTISNLRPILESAHVREMKDLDNIVHAISDVIGAMRNAFACTLLGIVASLLASLGAQAVLWYFQRAVLQPLDTYCSLTLVPFLSQSREYEAFSQASKEISATVAQLDKVVRAEQILLATFGQRASAATDALEKSGRAAAVALTQAGAALTQAGADAGQGLARSSRDAAGKITASVNTLGEQMDKTTRWLAQTGTTMQEALQALALGQAAVTTAVQQTKKAVAPLEQILTNLQTTAEQSLDDLQKVYQAGEEQASASAGRVEELFAGRLSDMAKSYEGASRESRDAALALEALMRTHLGGFETTLSDLAQRQEALLSAVAQLREITHAEMSDYAKQALGTLGSLAKSQTNHAGEMQTISQAQSAALKAMTGELSVAVRALSGLVQNAEVAFRDAVNERTMPGPPPRDNEHNGVGESVR